MTDELTETELPVRAPYTGPVEDYRAPIETVEVFADAVREWAEQS
jgi:hypothetical protein